MPDHRVSRDSATKAINTTQNTACVYNEFAYTWLRLFVPPALCREEHIQALLAVRGDASREMRQMIIGTLSENKVSHSGVTQSIFKDVAVPTIAMTTMTTMTSMATSKLLK